MQYPVNQGGSRGLAACAGDANDTARAGEKEEGDFHFDACAMLLGESQVGRGEGYAWIAYDHVCPLKIFIAMSAQYKFYRQARQGAHTWGQYLWRFHIRNSHYSSLLGCVSSRGHARSLQAQTHDEYTLSAQIHTLLPSRSFASLRMTMLVTIQGCFVAANNYQVGEHEKFGMGFCVIIHDERALTLFIFSNFGMGFKSTLFPEISIKI